jgi:hypothetical protein
MGLIAVLAGERANKVAVACRIFPDKTYHLKKPARRLDPNEAPRGRNDAQYPRYWTGARVQTPPLRV